MEREVKVCSGCVREWCSGETPETTYMNDFLKEVEKELQSLDPLLPKVMIATMSCQRFCPPDRVTLVFVHPERFPEGRLTMSKEATAKSVAEEMLKFLRA
ncbi:hypothetical protein D3C87_125710 [compost metagenome]